MTKKILQSYNFAGNQIVDVRIENLAAFPTAGKPGRAVFNTASGRLGVDDGTTFTPLLKEGEASGTGVAWADITGKPTTFAPAGHSHTTADIWDLPEALATKASVAHTHTASDVVDFDASVDARVIALIDGAAGSDHDIDTIRELMDLVKSNESGLSSVIGRFSRDIGDGSSTRMNVAHNLNSRDVTVEVYDKASGDTVGVGVTRTNANIVTIEATPAPATNELRVVVKK